MKSAEEEGSQRELVIIRRWPNGEVDAHRSGVWKIAYADFMTALMAFFLVMWLISATDEYTRAHVAAYFNPLKLTDKSPDPKGVYDMDVKAQGEARHPSRGKERSGKARAEKKGEADAPQDKMPKEDALFSDPYGVLAKLAVEAERMTKESEDARVYGETYRDPFDPAFRRDGPGANPADGKAEQAEASAPPAAQAEAARFETEIRRALQQSGLGSLPHIEVATTEEGLLISLTDDFDFGMFAVGSAEPRPELVMVMEKIAKLLAGGPGSIVIRGHTDGRPYKSGKYDNWRLSTARAHMAYYMLVRGGVPESRVERIEGHADRHLKAPGDPEAASNRRIEILLRKAKA